MTPDPSNADVIRHIDNRLEHEQRIRGLEIAMAKVEALPEQMKAMEVRLAGQISSLAPVRISQWQIVGILFSIVVAILGIGGVLYGAK